MAQEEFEVVISYVPLPDEVVPENYFHSSTATRVYLIPPNQDTDPILLVEKLSTRFNSSPVVVLIPGQAFDATGTRHGRGGGWYDRFLSAIPSEWRRIGFCTSMQFSISPLKRESWDEPVDEVHVIDTASHTTTYETHARETAA
jgi:5,10-methenyltetrahydrofolate synthetase